MKQNQSWITGSQNWVSKFGTRRHTLGSRPLAKSTLGQFPVEVVCPVVPFYPCSSDYEHGFHEADSPILLEAWQPFQFVEVLHRVFCVESQVSCQWLCSPVARRTRFGFRSKKRKRRRWSGRPTSGWLDTLLVFPKIPLG